MTRKQAFEGIEQGKTYKFPPESLIMIKDRKNPLWDPSVEEPLREADIASVELLGVLEPVIVYKDEQTGEPTIADGRKRTRWAMEVNARRRKLGLPEITVECKCIKLPRVKKGDTTAQARLLMIIQVAANEIRHEKGVMFKAEKATQMLERGVTLTEVALAFGVTEKAVEDWADLMDLHPTVLDAVDDKKLEASTAATLKKVPYTEQPKALADLLASAKDAGKKRPTVNDARKATGQKTRPGIKAIRKALANIPAGWGALEALEFTLGERELPSAASKPNLTVVSN